MGTGQIEVYEPVLRRMSNDDRLKLSVEVELPYSEVNMHMGIAGERWRVVPVVSHMAQLIRDDGSMYSIPITRGEAGLPWPSA